MPGYSAAPLAKKLGIRPGNRVLLCGEPEEVRVQLAVALRECDCVQTMDRPLDFTMVFSHSPSEFSSVFAQAVQVLAPGGIAWGCWPKKSSGVASDLDERGVRQIGLGTGLVDVKVCAVTDVWSGLKFVHRKAVRPRAVRNR
jgi:hypothetical protein